MPKICLLRKITYDGEFSEFVLEKKIHSIEVCCIIVFNTQILFAVHTLQVGITLEKIVFTNFKSSLSR